MYPLHMCKKTLFLFQFQLGKGGGILHATSQRDRWSWWSCLIQVVMLWAMQEPKPKRGFLRKSYNELFRCHFLDSSFVFFLVEKSKKRFHDSKMRTRTCAWKKSHLRIKNSWRFFLLAGHNHPGQQTSHLYTSPLWFSQGFATFKKRGVAPLHPIRSRSWNEPSLFSKTLLEGRPPPDLLWRLVRAKCSIYTWLV